MVAQRANKQANNTVKTPVQRAKNGLPTSAAALLLIPTRQEIPCACGCGACFVPTNNQHKYLKGHRYQRWLDDKKNATYALVHALFWVYGDFDDERATKIAQDTVDFHFSARCKILEKSGWKYVSEAKTWRYAA